MKENYIQHNNRWWWGKSITLIHKEGWASVEIQCDNDSPNVAFIKNLIVFEYKRKKGLELICCVFQKRLRKVMANDLHSYRQT